jgi:UDPglucose 6-dehydrogenase
VSRVAVIGAGYVGLTSAVCLAHLGHTVVCADISEERVRLLNSGVPPIVEADLAELLGEGLQSGRLRFVLGAANAVRQADFVFLCVPTPQGEDGSADLSFVEAAVREISNAVPSGSIVINKSTVPVGSAHRIARILDRSDVAVASNPEFLREGSAVHDFMQPSRIVVGADDERTARSVAALYADLPTTVVITDPASAETIKYAANAFLAMKLSFVNTIAAICEGVGADVDHVMKGVGLDSRIGSAFLKPGPGWGGSCFPKDMRALLKMAQDAELPFNLLREVIESNEQQFERVVRKIRKAAGGDLSDVAVGVWGLTFKAGTDDLRESPAVAIVERLLQEGARVSAYDPTVNRHRPGLPAPVEVCEDPYGVADGAAVLVVLTEWEEFGQLNPAKVAELMVDSQVVDARNLLDRETWLAAGFRYQGIGR